MIFDRQKHRIDLQITAKKIRFSLNSKRSWDNSFLNEPLTGSTLELYTDGQKRAEGTKTKLS